MGVLAKLTSTNLKRNKKRSIVTMIGVALSVALLFTVIAIPTSFIQTLKLYQIEQYGDFHQLFEYIPGDKVSLIENAEGVDSAYYARQITYDDETRYLDHGVSLIPVSKYERIDTLTDDQRTADQQYMVFIRFKQPLRKAGYAKTMPERYGKAICDTLDAEEVSGYYTRTNDELMMYDGNVDPNSSTILFCLAAFGLGLIVIASIFTIRNSFNISTTERTREFGMLSSVGATPAQIRRSVVLEALIIGAFSTPAGLLLGSIATFILLGITGSLIGAPTALVFFIPLWAVALDIVLGFVIVWLASASAAIRAGRLTPIEAIRSTQDINIKSKKLKTSAIIRSYFGIGGVIASKNLKRSRQKYRTTVISIVVSVAVFVGLSSFVIDGQRIVANAYPYKGTTYVVMGGSIDNYKEIESRFDLGEHAYFRYALASSGIKVATINSEYFEKYARSVGVYGDFENAAILNDYIPEQHSNGSYSIDRALLNKEGDELNLRIVDVDSDSNDPIRTFNTKITKITDKNPIGDAQLRMPTLYVSDKHTNAGELVLSKYENRLFANPSSKQAEEITKYIEKINEETEPGESSPYAFDLAESMEQINNVMLLLAIFMYGFIAVVALIGVTNIFNTITTNIQLRAKEFAMLKSVGMTDDEFNRMIRLESLLYSLRALLIGLPIGIIISYAVHSMLSAGGMNLSYELPVVPILISIVVVALLITVIMRYSVRQVSHQNIIETIRQDTV